MAPSVEKKIAELEMGLLHLQQNIDIPEITLTIHPTVAAVIKKCAEEGRTPKVTDFGDKVDDAQFLNTLQSGVNRWIREIQKVNFEFSTLSIGSTLILVKNNCNKYLFVHKSGHLKGVCNHLSNYKLFCILALKHETLYKTRFLLSHGSSSESLKYSAVISNNILIR